MAKPETRIVRVKSWADLPEVLEPGEYHVGGERFVIYEPIERDVWLRIVKGIREMHRKYYG